MTFCWPRETSKGAKRPQRLQPKSDIVRPPRQVDFKSYDPVKEPKFSEVPVFGSCGIHRLFFEMVRNLMGEGFRMRQKAR